MSQKKLIALAVMAAMTAPAFADTGNVTVYGLAHLSVDSVKQADGLNALKVSSNVSKLGFKGAEGLDEGLSAIWQIEQQINMDNTTQAGGTGTFATRNTFVGLKSDAAGTVLLGRHDTPYKLATGKLDIFRDYLADNRSLMGGVAGKSAGASFDGRPTDVMAYISPSLGGFVATLAYVAGAEGQLLSTQSKGNAISAAGTFTQGDFFGSLAYEEHNFGTAAGTMNGALNTKESATKLGLGYKIDALELGLAYEQTRDNLGVAFANKYGHKAYYLSGKYTMGANVLKLAYTKAGATATVNTNATQVTAGFEHNFSKRTAAYLNYTALKNGTAGTYTFATSGSTAGGIANALPGMSLSAFSLGVKHAF
jgi:predicted porin